MSQVHEPAEIERRQGRSADRCKVVKMFTGWELCAQLATRGTLKAESKLSAYNASSIRILDQAETPLTVCPSPVKIQDYPHNHEL